MKKLLYFKNMLTFDCPDVETYYCIPLHILSYLIRVLILRALDSVQGHLAEIIFSSVNIRTFDRLT